MLARMKVWLEFKRRRKRTSRKNRIDGMGWDVGGRRGARLDGIDPLSAFPTTKPAQSLTRRVQVGLEGEGGVCQVAKDFLGTAIHRIQNELQSVPL